MCTVSRDTVPVISHLIPLQDMFGTTLFHFFWPPRSHAPLQVPLSGHRSPHATREGLPDSVELSWVAEKRHQHNSSTAMSPRLLLEGNGNPKHLQEKDRLHMTLRKFFGDLRQSSSSA